MMTLEELTKFLEGETVQERANSYCGEFHVKTTIEGGISIGVHRCGQHRTCQFCHDIRKNEFRARLTLEKNPDDLIAIICTEEEAKKLIRSRKTTADDYLRSPLMDGNVIIAISKETADSVENFEYEQWAYVVDEENNIDPIILESFANLPEGKRTSGDLGKFMVKKEIEPEIPAPIDENDVFVLPYPRYLVRGGEFVINEAFVNATISSSKNGKPTDAESLTAVLQQRFRDYEMNLITSGVEFMVVRYSEKVVSLKYMLENVIILQEVVPDVKITLNSSIGKFAEPLGKTFKRALDMKIYEYERGIPLIPA